MVILTPLAKSISIPAFREEGDYALCTDAVKVHIFQSPPSVRKATLVQIWMAISKGISIPAFREEGDLDSFNIYHLKNISIPAFREEGDRNRKSCKIHIWDFNPRLP